MYPFVLGQKRHAISRTSPVLSCPASALRDLHLLVHARKSAVTLLRPLIKAQLSRWLGKCAQYHADHKAQHHRS